jgi:hypothetical protein
MANKVKSETEMKVEVPTTEVFEMLKSADAKNYSDEFLKEEQIKYNTMANEFGELLKVKKYTLAKLKIFSKSIFFNFKICFNSSMILNHLV